MQNKINKIIWFLFLVLLIGLIIYIGYDNLNKKKRENEYVKKIFYMDTYIYIKIYSNNKDKANKILNNVEKIYKEYHELTDKYNSYEGINNLYYLKNNKNNKEYIEIDKRLYEIIKYGKSWYKKSGGLIDISMGDVLDIWKKYRDNKNGIPNYEELQKAKNNIENIVLKDENKIKNNHVNIDLGSIAKGYTTKIVGEYLKKNNINKFLINAGGNVLVGDNFKNKKYTIGIEDPNSKTKDIFKIVTCNNMAVVTSGGYERYYEYEGKKYHHIIDPNTLFPTNYMKSVTVVTDDSALGDILSTTLFLMSVEDGKKFIENYDNVEVIWYTNDDKQVMSKGFKKYIYE